MRLHVSSNSWRLTTVVFELEFTNILVSRSVVMVNDKTQWTVLGALPVSQCPGPLNTPQ